MVSRRFCLQLRGDHAGRRVLIVQLCVLNFRIGPTDCAAGPARMLVTSLGFGVSVVGFPFLLLQGLRLCRLQAPGIWEAFVSQTPPRQRTTIAAEAAGGSRHDAFCLTPTHTSVNMTNFIKPKMPPLQTYKADHTPIRNNPEFPGNPKTLNP